MTRARHVAHVLVDASVRQEFDAILEGIRG
jgi:hypothetical protein